MRLFISVFLCLLFTIVPVNSVENDIEYLAVFCNPGFNSEWVKYKPDLFFQASKWEDFENFLLIVKKRAGNRPVVIDIDSHGNDSGLWLEYKDIYGVPFSDGASVGYIAKKIQDSKIKQKRLKVLLEACFAGRAYKFTIRNNKNLSADYCNFEKIPKYPIYGIGDSHPNFGNLIYLQYRYNFQTYFVDLRSYEYTNLKDKVDEKSSKEDNIIRLFWTFLFTYGP